MKSFFAVAALAAVAYASPQGVTADLTPTAAAPSGCVTNYAGPFGIQALNASSMAKRSLTKRQGNSLDLHLTNGQIMDENGYTLYTASENNQLQFDKPVQAGALYTGGFSVCPNMTIALGGSAVWWLCPSGRSDGTVFNNIFEVKQYDDCTPGYLEAYSPSGSMVPVSSSAAVSSSVPAVTSVLPVTGTTPVTSISDHQVQAPSSVPSAAITSISDHQIQAPSSVPSAAVTSISDHQIQAPSSVPAAMNYTATPTPFVAGASKAAGAVGAGVVAVAALFL